MPLGPKPGLLIGFEPAPPFEGSFFSTMIACKHPQADMVNSSAIQDTIALKLHTAPFLDRIVKYEQ